MENNFLNDKDLILIRNRTNGTVGYTIPDLNNLHRDFEPNEQKKIPMEELRRLSYVAGGYKLLSEFLLIETEEAREEILPDVEPEYFLDEDGVRNLLLNKPVENLIDALNFAPRGVIELIKKYAVELKLNDYQKRAVITKATGLNISQVIDNEIANEEERASEEKVEAPTRLAKDTETENKVAEAPKRVAATPKYTVTKK